MNIKKLHLATLALLLPTTVAQADIRAGQVAIMNPSSKTDLAPVNGATPPRLRRTQNEEPGNEMAHAAFFADGIHGLYFVESTDLNGVKPQNRVQMALIPFALVQNADKSVTAAADMTKARFATTNNGSELRNANNITAFAANDGTVVCAQYNYRPNNNTHRYMQCFNQAGQTVLAQTKIYDKNNDDCAMNQDATASTALKAQIIGAKSVTKFVNWFGCNGNGQDDGWAAVQTLSCDSATSPTACTFAQQMDVSLCAREERSHGLCTVGTDATTATCTWTEGNNQPQRDGTWVAAIDLTKTGNDNQGAILWKQQIGSRVVLPDGTRTYAMRMMHERVMATDPVTGALSPTDDIVIRYGQVAGNNGNNGQKGGRYLQNMMGVATVTRTGLVMKTPMTDMAAALIGLDGTHLGMAPAIFGTTDKPTPGIVFMGGSHTGGSYGLQMQTVGIDQTSGKLTNLGMMAGAPYDRHLYPNYLGQNPGNQGRNFSGAELIKNPFVKDAATNPGEDAYLMVMTTTGKTQADSADARIKLTAFLTVVPVAQHPMTPTGTGTGSGSGSGTGTGTGSGSGSGSGSGTTPDPTTPTDPATTDPGTNLGGCSTSGGTTGAMTFLLMGLAAFIRRRR